MITKKALLGASWLRAEASGGRPEPVENSWLTVSAKAVILRAFFPKWDDVNELPHIRLNLICI